MRSVTEPSAGAAGPIPARGRDRRVAGEFAQAPARRAAERRVRAKKVLTAMSRGTCFRTYQG